MATPDEASARPPPIPLETITFVEIATPPDGVHVDRCRFSVPEGQFRGWSCGTAGWELTLGLPAHTAEALTVLLARVDDWGEPLAADAPDTADMITIGLRDHVARFAVGAAEPASRAALRIAAMRGAQEALAQLRARGESCTGCREGEYCEEGYECETLGPKNCAMMPLCHTRLPSTSACDSDYQCRSAHCDGTTSVHGRCR